MELTRVDGRGGDPFFVHVVSCHTTEVLSCSAFDGWPIALSAFQSDVALTISTSRGENRRHAGLAPSAAQVRYT